MSSWLGHGAGALALARGLSKRPLGKARTAVLLGMAIMPDIVDHTLDDTKLRWSHSPAAIAVMAIMGFGALALLSRRADPRDFGLCLLAALSHLLLDLLVGVNRYALLWPFSRERVGLPFGLLPSAPGLSLTNRYLYRNLALELLIFMPALYLGYCGRLGDSRTWAALLVLVFGLLASAPLIR